MQAGSNTDSKKINKIEKLTPLPIGNKFIFLEFNSIQSKKSNILT
jgi:hypothetical protein